MMTVDRDIVLFIGAGFSRDAGLPLMSEFGIEAKKDHTGLRSHMGGRDRRNAAPMLVKAAETFEKFQALLSDTCALKNGDIDNIETVFSIAEALQESGQKDIVLDRQLSLSELTSDIKLWIWKVYQQLPIVSLYSNRKEEYKKIYNEVYSPFFELLTSKKIAQRITVLSTNYDIVYEYLSYKKGLKCAYPIPKDMEFRISQSDIDYIESFKEDSDTTLMCKLHGSVNYFEDPDKEDDKLYVAVDLRDRGNSPSSLLVDSIWNIKVKYGKNLTPAIIPPTYAKLRHRPWLRAIWNTALEALKKAKIIVFIGYSITESDGFMRALFQGALAQRKNISSPSVYVIDPDPCQKIHKRYENIFHSMIKPLVPQDLKTAISNALPEIFKNIS